MADSPTIGEMTWRTQGNPHYERVYRLSSLNPIENERPMRTTVRIDFYKFQSWAKVERWDGNRWQTVVHRAGDRLICWQHARGVSTKLLDQDFEPDLTEIDAEAWEILNSQADR